MAMTEASREVGVVVRRRAIDNPWIDHIWSPAMVLDEVPPRFGGAPVLCHGDIAPEHILVDEAGGRVLGLIDFGDLLVGDPAIDLAGVCYLGGDAALARLGFPGLT